MLLSSSLPFYGTDCEQVMKRILANKFHFRAKRFKSVSPQAKAFIKDLLVSDPDERLDADSALGSEWLNLYLQSGPTSARHGPRPEEEEMARASMLRYAGYSKLKKMVSKNQYVVTMIRDFDYLPFVSNGLGTDGYCSQVKQRRDWSLKETV